jgi:hypothetical protein
MLPVTYIVHRNSSTDDESDAFLRHFRVLEDQRNRHACYRLHVHQFIAHATFPVEVSLAPSQRVPTRHERLYDPGSPMRVFALPQRCRHSLSSELLLWQRQA